MKELIFFILFFLSCSKNINFSFSKEKIREEYWRYIKEDKDEDLIEYSQNNNLDIIKERDELGDTSIIVAAKYNSLKVLNIILENSNLAPILIFEALIEATKNGHIHAVELILKKGTDIDIDLNQSDDEKRTALMYAAGKGYTNIVKLLMRRFSHLNLKDIYKRTALIYAASNGHENIVKLLLEEGARLNIKDEFDKTALIYAASNGHGNIVKLLLEERSKFNIEDMFGKIALMESLLKGHENSSELLLKKTKTLKKENY